MLLTIVIILNDVPLSVVLIRVNRDMIRVRRDHVRIRECTRWTGGSVWYLGVDGRIWGNVVCFVGGVRSQSRLAVWLVRFATSCLEPTKGTSTTPAEFPYFANHATYCLKGERCPTCRSRRDCRDRFCYPQPRKTV